MNIEIKSWVDGHVLFSAEATTLKEVVELAVKSQANLSQADLSLADLSQANLYQANLYHADLSLANLYQANLYHANLYHADLSQANLYQANLSLANLYQANLYHADLSHANLYQADLSHANLSHANLYQADLSQADLSHANLYHADLSHANLYQAVGVKKHLITPLLFLYDQPGFIRAYKLVNAEGEGLYNGVVVYRIGESVSVENANGDDTLLCGAGINLATLDWCMREWREGYRILIAEFIAQDIAAIPTSTDGKFRVHRCKIVGEKNLEELGLVKTQQEQQ